MTPQDIQMTLKEGLREVANVEFVHYGAMKTKSSNQSLYMLLTVSFGKNLTGFTIHHRVEAEQRPSPRPANGVPEVVHHFRQYNRHYLKHVPDRTTVFFLCRVWVDL